jgi:hypothetical protein
MLEETDEPLGMGVVKTDTTISETPFHVAIMMRWNIVTEGCGA